MEFHSLKVELYNINTHAANAYIEIQFILATGIEVSEVKCAALNYG